MPGQTPSFTLLKKLRILLPKQVEKFEKIYRLSHAGYRDECQALFSSMTLDSQMQYHAWVKTYHPDPTIEFKKILSLYHSGDMKGYQACLSKLSYENLLKYDSWVKASYAHTLRKCKKPAINMYISPSVLKSTPEADIGKSKLPIKPRK